jgi:hypothetical protein
MVASEFDHAARRADIPLSRRTNLDRETSSMASYSSREPIEPQREWDSWIATVIAFLLALPVMSRLTGLLADPAMWNTDHSAHLVFAVKLAADWRECLPHPLYHVTVVAMSAGNAVAMPGIAATVLAAMFAMKFQLIVRTIAHDHVLTCNGASSSEIASTVTANPNWGWWLAIFLATLVSVAMPLPNWWKTGIVVGQPSPTVWHNPTTIFCMPIVLLLFPIAVRSAKSLGMRGSLLTGTLFVLCTLAKPNYPLAFAPCCGLMLAGQLLISRGVDTQRWVRILCCGFAMLAPLVLLLGLQFWMEFGTPKPEASGIEFAPFKVWRQFTPNFSASVILALAFPMSVAALYWQKLCRDEYLGWAWLTMAIAMLQLIMLAEKGPRWMHGNFLWGAIFSSAIVFIYSARLLQNSPRNFRRICCELVLIMHAGSGLVCLTRAVMDPRNVTSF